MDRSRQAIGYQGTILVAALLFLVPVGSGNALADGLIADGLTADEFTADEPQADGLTAAQASTPEPTDNPTDNLATTTTPTDNLAPDNPPPYNPPTASDVDAEPFVQVRALVEVGMLAPLKHSIKVGSNGTRLDYIKQGGQDNLFLAWRISAELKLAARHSLVFLYQPLDIRTTITAEQEMRFDDTVFPAGTPVDLQYGFPFYRFSYMYDFLEGRKADISLGLSLQIRNANIVFTAADGTARTARRDIGFVPLIKLAGMYRWDSGVWLGGEVDGIYAPIKYLNGGDSDVEGAFIDLSARVGYRVLAGTDLFLNVRYLGGGAGGTGDGGYTDNWLHFLTATIGVQLDFMDLAKRWPSLR